MQRANLPITHVLFVGNAVHAAGDLLTVAQAFREAGSREAALIFETETGRQIDVDVSGGADALKARYGGGRGHRPAETGAASKPRGRGRPRLGVVGREVTLLPRHWEWLDRQRGGASATLRRLVDEARRANRHADAVRQSQDRTNRFLSALAGDLPGFEEATRALYAGDQERFDAETRRWPGDVRHWARELAREAFTG